MLIQEHLKLHKWLILFLLEVLVYRALWCGKELAFRFECLGGWLDGFEIENDLL